MLIEGRDPNGNPYYMNFFDAFYFVSYMASTIGFGEAPYEFTYPQRMWVSACIYLTVIGWFYGIGTIIALIQDKRLAREISITRYKNKVESLTEEFIIILGYNNVTKNIIHRLNEENIRVVVIDKDENKINELELENFNPEVPAIAAEATDPNILKISGIHKKNCKAVVALFENDAKNAKVALMSKLLNKKVDVIVKSTTKEHTEHLQNIGIRHIENPFKIISKRMYLALTKPHIWILEMWVFGHILKIKKREILPYGKYIICGYGRMGHALEHWLKKAGIKTIFIDIVSTKYQEEKQSSIYGDAEDIETLLSAGIKDANAIIAATKDDLINLTILSTARKLNPKMWLCFYLQKKSQLPLLPLISH
jgi:Trk K+ transport system NAD-binding subunit